MSLIIILIIKLILMILILLLSVNGQDDVKPLVVSFDNAIPLSLMDKLIAECTTISSFSLNRENYLHGKSQTYWFDTKNIDKKKEPKLIL